MANKYLGHDQARNQMAYQKIKNPCKVATILFDTFILRNAKLLLEHCREKKLCPKSGEFYAWRNELKEKEWLNFDFTPEGKLKRYYPGTKLIPFINAIKNKYYELATTEDIYKNNEELKQNMATKEELEKLKKRMSKSEKAIFDLINRYDPPASIEKFEDALSGTYEITLN